MFKKKDKDKVKKKDNVDMQTGIDAGVDMQTSIDAGDDLFNDFDESGSDELVQIETIQEGLTSDLGINEAVNRDTHEDKQNKKDKKPEKGKREKGKTNNAKISADSAEESEVEAVKQNMILYVIVDKPIFGLINYFRESGVNVSNIFSDITEAKSAVLMQSEPTRIVVIDTGLGKFTTTSMRAELIDMLGISDEHNKTTVFYTDSVLKVDTSREIGKSSKKIDWLIYKSTAVVVATLLSYRENYVTDIADENDITEDEHNILSSKGLTMGKSVVMSDRMHITGFSPEAIMRHMIESTDEGLPGFEIRL